MVGPGRHLGSLRHWMFLRKSHERIQISRSCMRVHIELCAGDNPPTHFKMLMFQQLIKHHHLCYFKNVLSRTKIPIVFL